MSSIVKTVIDYGQTIPNKAAIIYDNRAITYKELAKKIECFATSLKTKKIAKGSRILIEADNTIQYIAAFLACALYGCIAVPIEKNISIYKLQDIITTTRPKLIFMKNNGESYDDYFNVATTSPFTEPKDDAIISITCTTGTTGKPSLITHTNTSSYATAQNLSSGIDINPDTVIYTNIPFYLAAGYRRVFAALYMGATIITSNTLLSIEDIKDYSIKYNVSHMSLVCTDISKLIKEIDDSSLFSNLRVVESAAGELSPSVTTSFYQVLPNTVLYNVYGTTEAGCLLVNNTRENHAENCLGKPTVNTTLHLIDENGFTITEPGKYGYVAVSGDMTMNGYYKKKELTEQVKSNNRLILKDIVYFDENGYYYFVSRVGDIINVMGHKVTPSRIEKMAMTFGGIKDCACVGKKDNSFGQVPVLYIECHDQNSFNTDELKEYLGNNLESYSVPREVIIIDKIPRTLTGKLMRKSLSTVL